MTKNAILTYKDNYSTKMNTKEFSVMKGLRNYINKNAVSILFGLEACAESSYGFFRYTAPALLAK